MEILTTCSARSSIRVLKNGQFDTINHYASTTTSSPVAESTYGYDDAERLTDLTHIGTDNYAAFHWDYISATW